MVFNNSYSGGTGGADYACNKIHLYGGGNAPTTNTGGVHGFGISGNGSEYFSNNNHLFFTNSKGGTVYGDERLRITSTGNVGIGTNNPQAFLDITYSSPSIENKDMLNIKTDSNWGLKIQQAFTQAGNIQYNFIHRYLTVDYNSLTFKGANVGIGTATPGFRLEVGGGTNSVTITGWQLYSVGTSSYPGPWDNLCAKFNGGLWSTHYYMTSSDIRIKEDIQDILDDTALQSILSIEPKTYKYVDKLNRGDKKVYGFIAQQIREVIPEAVSIQVSYIPNIYLVADYIDSVITLSSQPTKVIIKMNDKIKCYDKDNKEILVEVIEVIDDLTFRIKEIEYTDTKIFVYGTFIDDFHTLNKDYIFTLNVCATQELHRRIEAQSVLLKSQYDRIKDLETKVATLMSNM